MQDTNEIKKQRIRRSRSRLEILYDLLTTLRNGVELNLGEICINSRTSYKLARQIIDSCLDANIVKITQKKDNIRTADFISLTSQGHQLLSLFDKLCLISGYIPISERK